MFVHFMYREVKVYARTKSSTGNSSRKWALNIMSVIVFGRIEFIEDRETTYRISADLSRKFTDDEKYIRREIDRSGPGTLLFALVPEHITGKIVNES